MSLSNSLGLLGRKVGMMRLFTDDGDAVPVTVVDVANNRVTQVKTQDNDGYVALQVTFGARKASRLALVGHEPDLGELAAKLLGARGAVEFKKDAVCRIDVTRAMPGGPGVLRWFLPPRALRGP